MAGIRGFDCGFPCYSAVFRNQIARHLGCGAARGFVPGFRCYSDGNRGQSSAAPNTVIWAYVKRHTSLTGVTLAARGLLVAADLAGLDAGRADVQALGRPRHDSANGLDVGVPAAAGSDVRVRDVVAEARPLTADVADGSHGSLH